MVLVLEKLYVAGRTSGRSILSVCDQEVFQLRIILRKNNVIHRYPKVWEELPGLNHTASEWHKRTIKGYTREKERPNGTLYRRHLGHHLAVVYAIEK